MFRDRSIWNTFPDSFLDALAAKLGNDKNQTEFALFCENANILQNHMGQFDLASTERGISQIVTVLTSYGYKMAKMDRYEEARQAWGWALLLEPRYLSAWVGMAVLSFNEGDHGAAIYWADKVLEYQPDPNSSELIEVLNAQMITGEHEEEAARVMNEPKMVGLLDTIKEQMFEIKRMCGDSA